MKMMMRIQKAQLPSLYKWTVARDGTVFNKELHEIAGYRNFQAYMVGAAGGKSGQANGSSTANIAYASGGGGGGLLHIAGAMQDLVANQHVFVGSKGADGKNSANTVKAGDGSAGGDSSFGVWWAQGGRGGVGGKISQVGGGASYTASKGGAGGTNSEAVGSAGAGGNPSPTQGNYGSSGNSSGGGGGGGGGGRVKISGAVQVAASAGAAGLSGSAAYTAPGGAVASYKGGGGGGANVGLVLPAGSPEYYGSIATGHDPDGVVILTLT